MEVIETRLSENIFWMKPKIGLEWLVNYAARWKAFHSMKSARGVFAHFSSLNVIRHGSNWKIAMLLYVQFCLPFHAGFNFTNFRLDSTWTYWTNMPFWYSTLISPVTDLIKKRRDRRDDLAGRPDDRETSSFLLPLSSCSRVYVRESLNIK